MGEYCLRRLLLFIRWIAALLQNSFHEHAELGANALFHGSIDRDVLADTVHQFAGNAKQGRLTEHFAALSSTSSIVESQLILRHAKIIAAFVGLAHGSSCLHVAPDLRRANWLCYLHRPLNTTGLEQQLPSELRAC